MFFQIQTKYLCILHLLYVSLPINSMLDARKCKLSITIEVRNGYKAESKSKSLKL